MGVLSIESSRRPLDGEPAASAVPGCPVNALAEGGQPGLRNRYHQRKIANAKNYEEALL